MVKIHKLQLQLHASRRGIEINRSPIGENFPLPAFFPTSAFPSSFLLTSRFPSDTDIGERTHREWLRFNECLTTRSLHLGTKIMRNQQVCVFMFLYSYVFLCLVLYSIKTIYNATVVHISNRHQHPHHYMVMTRPRPDDLAWRGGHGRSWKNLVSGQPGQSLLFVSSSCNTHLINLWSSLIWL